MVRSPYLRIIVSVVIAVAVAAAIVGVLRLGHERKTAQRSPHAGLRHTAERAPPDDMRRVLATVESATLRADMERIYAAVDYRPLWSGSRSNARRMHALEETLAEVSREGVKSPASEAARAAVGNADGDARMKADLVLTEQVLDLAKGLRSGFTDLADWYIPADDVDVTGDVAAGLADGRVQKLFRALAPNHPQYRALVAALARYETIRANGGWPTVAGDGITLRRRLAAEGFRSAAGKTELTESVKAFQAHNGLAPDGRVGAATLAALNVPVDERIGQIVANLERWRHMPHDLGDRYIVANVADQTVAIMQDGKPAWTTRAIVGERDNPTPVIKADITGVVLNPTWEIPPSIARTEIMPKLRQDPDYLADRNIVITDTSGKTQWTVYGWDPEFADSPPGRLRQLPGVGNALGALKFQMENRFNIYLHDTPNRALFADGDRYRSHGCVRVENPTELARRLLGRDAQGIEAEIATGKTKTLRMSAPLPVYVVYWTAFADNDDGTLQFREDAYGRDQPIVAALGFATVRKPAQVVSRSEDPGP
jgi:murein L,D-transpeptidase YcbB/YkuD